MTPPTSFCWPKMSKIFSTKIHREKWYTGSLYYLGHVLLQKPINCLSCDHSDSVHRKLTKRWHTNWANMFLPQKIVLNSQIVIPNDRVWKIYEHNFCHNLDVRSIVSSWKKVMDSCESSCLSLTINHVQVVVSYVTNRRIEMGCNSRFTNSE